MHLCPAFRHIGGKQRDFLKCASSQLSLAQNNQSVKVVYFRWRVLPPFPDKLP